MIKYWIYEKKTFYDGRKNNKGVQSAFLKMETKMVDEITANPWLIFDQRKSKVGGFFKKWGKRIQKRENCCSRKWLDRFKKRKNFEIIFLLD